MPVTVRQTERISKPSAFGWAVLTFFATATGLFSLRYALPKVPLPGPPNFWLRHNWLVTHAIASSIALLTGPWQFLPAIRRRWLNAHRWLGRIYCGAVLIGWIASLPIAAHADYGAISSVGFLILGIIWISCTAAGYFTIRQGRVAVHQEWMIRSYALTAAAITLRNYLPLLVLAEFSFSTAYRTIAWLCWIPNLLFAEWLIRRRRQSK